MAHAHLLQCVAGESCKQQNVAAPERALEACKFDGADDRRKLPVGRALEYFKEWKDQFPAYAENWRRATRHTGSYQLSARPQ